MVGTLLSKRALRQAACDVECDDYGDQLIAIVFSPGISWSSLVQPLSCLLGARCGVWTSP